jgi:hypothetical protein
MISDFDDEYEPTSTPKIRPVPRKQCEQSIVKQIPERVYRLLNNPMWCPYVTPKFLPITNIDGYIRAMGHTGEKEVLCRKMYTPEPDEVVIQEVKFEPVSSDPLYVYVNMNVLKNGLIRVKITVPMEPVYEYQRKGKMAPLDVRIRAAKAVGYPDSVLTQMIKNHDEIKSKQAKLDEFIDLIFGKSINAKVSKPKAKTVHESLNTKLKKRPAKKY